MMIVNHFWHFGGCSPRLKKLKKVHLNNLLHCFNPMKGLRNYSSVNLNRIYEDGMSLWESKLKYNISILSIYVDMFNKYLKIVDK